MNHVKAGVVVVTKFCKSSSKAFYSYIDYVDREEAARSNNTSKYNLYQDYMGNPEKSTGLFTETGDVQTMEEKTKLKDIFKQAQSKDSLMWQTVISFDNKWLEKNGLYSSKDKVLDEERLKGITRSAIHKMLEKEGLENAVWSAAIHYNTDNIHVHVATVEPEPMREKKKYIQYKNREVNGKTVKEPILDSDGQPVVKEEYKGKFKQSSIDTCKREIVNQIINERENNLKINSILRDSILKQKREHPLVKDKELCRMFLELHKNMPDCNRNMWNYNNPIMHSLKPQIDEITLCYIEKYHKEEFKQFQKMIEEQTEKYREAYGGDSDYAKGKMDDMYSRMGNAILKEIRAFDKEYKDKTISEDYVQWYEQDENELGVISDPQFKSDDLAEKEKKYFEHYNTKDIISSQYSNLNEVEQYFRWEEDKYIFNSIPENGFNIEWSKQYKLAKKYIYNKKPEYEKAILLLKHEDMEGNILASYELGDVYRFGRGTEINIEMAEKYYAKTLQGFLNIEEKEAHGNNKFMKEYLPYRVGKMYYYGLGTEQNFEKAYEMFETSGSIFSKYMLGKMAYAGQGMEQNYELAYQYFSECANQNAYAAYQAASMIDTGKIVESESKMHEYYKQAFAGFATMEKKSPSDNLEYRIGCMYLEGKGVEKDEKIAEEYLSISAGAGNIYSKNKLAMLYLKRGDVNRIPEIIETLKEVAEKTDNIWSMYALGNIYSSEKYNCKDIELAVKWYKQAEKNGNEYISYKLGKIYLNEQSQYYSLDKGIEHMQKAYEKGNMMAAYQLGKIYADKSKECYDLEKAIDYYKEAAENENALAAYQLGKIYLNENNGKQNIQEAIYYLKLAAKKDSQFATYQLGKVYYDEKYGLKNDTKAYHWFEKSAKEGNNRATYQMAKIDYEKQNYTNAAKLFQKVDDVYSHYYLGKIYLDESKGNPLYNPKKGLMYLKQASSEGNTFASMAIGLSYLRGEGVKRDVKTAKDWLNLASGQGNEYASEILKKINSNHSGRPQIKIGVSMTTAISKMKKGLKSEWEKTKLQREHDRMIENSLE